MVLVYPPDQKEQVRPEQCPHPECENQRFHSNGAYWRSVAEVLVNCFVCTACGRHVSVLPSTCIPYKHYRTDTVDRVLSNLVEQKRSAPQQEREGSGITVSCMYRWYHELESHINMLATEGAKRLGISPLSGVFQTTWRSLKAHVGAEGFLMRLQEALARDYPPLGIFRTLIPMSNS